MHRSRPSMRSPTAVTGSSEALSGPSRMPPYSRGALHLWRSSDRSPFSIGAAHLLEVRGIVLALLSGRTHGG